VGLVKGLTFLSQGGILMIPIGICSLLALAFIIERWLTLARSEKGAEGLVATVKDHLSKNQIKDAYAACEESPGAIARILQVGIENYDSPKEDIAQMMEKVGELEVIPSLERFLWGLSTIAQVAPLLGFLGTVTGMIMIFTRIYSKMQDNMGLGVASFNPTPDLFDGIWQALLTTASGLVVAIPALIAYNYFINRVDRQINTMEKAALEIIDVLKEEK
jgi:biopolymer transport protein ExbB